VIIDRTNFTEINLLRSGLNWTVLAAAATEYPPAVQAAFAQAQAINTRLDTAQKEVASRKEARSATEAEQKRLRESLPAVPANSDLARRYLKDLTAVEDKLAAEQKGIEALQAVANAAKKELDDFLSALTLP
jgi:ERCC4-type nuclease